MMSGPLLVVHAVPLTDTTDVFESLQHGGNLRPAPECSGWNNRFNLDGYLSYTPGQICYGYTMVMRDGAFEGVQVQTANAADPPMMHGYSIEKDLLFCVELFTRLSRGAGYTNPIVLLATLLGCKGKRILANLQGFASRHDTVHTFDRDALTLPDVTLEGPAVSSEVLRPMFDALWQAGGAPGSPSYGPNGTWTHPGRRD